MLNATSVPINAVSRLLFCLVLAGSLCGQQVAGSLLGTVADESGAVLPGATITIRQDGVTVQQLQSDAAGKFSVTLKPGKYSIHASAEGFESFDSELQAKAAAVPAFLQVTLKIAATLQQVTVTSDNPSGVALDSSANADAVVVQGAELDALPDDAQDLRQDLNALAGPAIGSGSTQTYVDGFSSSQLPPKNMIREVRINQDPFSAQYDHVGFGRVEVVTKPGSGQIHGTAQFRMGDALFNSRNPYTPLKPFYRAEDFTGNVGGPLSKRASFFLNVDRRSATDNEVVNASIIGPALAIAPLTQAVLMPNDETTIGGRFDYQFSDKHSLTARYEWDRSSLANTGVGGFLLPSSAYSLTGNVRTLQVTENAILSSTAINQTRFQFIQTDLAHRASGVGPSIQVMDAFTSGAAVMGNSQSAENLWEIQNTTTKTVGNHTFSFGGRFRRDALYDYSPGNFGGTFVFSGGIAPKLNALNQIVLGANNNSVIVPLSSIERYQRNLVLQQAGFSPPGIAALGGGASQFSIAAGQPASSLTQLSLGMFVQDNWRLSPALSLDAGFRWEGQSDIHDWKDFAPRMGLAWMSGGKQGKTVLRAGAGIFYDRFPLRQMLLTERFNGHTQQQFVVNDPSFFPQVPSLASLQSMSLPQTIRTLAPNLRSPYFVEMSLSVERELPLGILAALSYINTKGEHLPVSQNVTLPGASKNPTDYQYTTAGILNGNQFVASARKPMHNGYTFYAYYEYGRVFSNTDGISTFPAKQFNLAADYGRAATDIRHSFVMGGSMNGPFGAILSPFLVARSGAPFNITTGHDNNGDTLFTDRPALASPDQAGALATPYGVFNPNPGPAAILIPHNYAQGPGFITLNLRIARAFGFGAMADGGLGTTPSRSAIARMFAAPSAKHHYNLTAAIILRNVMNTNNPGMPVGNLTSPYFGRSNWLASTAGPADMASGNNRRLQFQLRVDF